MTVSNKNSKSIKKKKALLVLPKHFYAQFFYGQILVSILNFILLNTNTKTHLYIKKYVLVNFKR